MHGGTKQFWKGYNVGNIYGLLDMDYLKLVAKKSDRLSWGYYTRIKLVKKKKLNK